MGQALQEIKPVGSINTDVADRYLKATDKRYALNSEALPGRGVNTSAPANVLLAYQQPTGENKEIKSFFSGKTNETYVFVFNSLGNHHIYRINGRDNTIQIVLLDPLLNFSDDPKYQVRIGLFYNHNSFVDEANKISRKYLVWTDGRIAQGFLDVETSIATGGFRNSYYSTGDRTQLWQLAPRPSLVCPFGDFIPIDPDDEDELSKPNKVKENTWQLRTKFIYTDGRQSAWSPISTTFILNSYSCNPDAIGLPRTIKLFIDAGGPHVEQIVVAFRNCPGNFTPTEDANFYQTAIINRYKEALGGNQPFYTRSINDEYVYDRSANTFEFNFSNDGTCIPIDRKETDRNYNNIPFQSFALAPLNKNLCLINNTFGFDPINSDILKKISLSTSEPDVQDCQIEMVKIKIAVIVHNVWRQNNEPIFVYENPADDTEGLTKYFGGLCQRKFLDTPFDDPGPYGQAFADKGKDAGFIAYVEGTGLSCVMKQYKFNGSSYQEFMQKDFSDKGTRRGVSKDINDSDYYFISMGEIQVVKGTTGIIRLASHKSLLTDNYADTSTTVLGVYLNRNNYHAASDVDDGNCDFLKKEIWFSACDGDVDLTGTPFIVADLTGPFADVGAYHSAATAFTGYARDKNGVPVVGAEVVPFGEQYGAYSSLLTDHNGFYFASELFDDIMIFFTHDSGIDFNIEGNVCQKVNGGGYGLGTNTSRPNQTFDNDVTLDTANYLTNYLQDIRVKVEDKNGLPIPGVTVSMENQKSVITASDGYANFAIRNIIPTYGSRHTFKLAPMQSGVCFLTLTGCEPCVPIRVVNAPSCFYNTPEIILTAFGGFNSLPLQRGWHPGGTFPVAAKFMDAEGRETFAEEIGTVTTPSIQAKQSFNFSLINWSIAGPLNLPREFVRMSLLVGRNRNIDDFMTWVVDKVEFVDNAGGPANSGSAEKIFLSIRSLYDAQSLYATGTNVKYQFKPGDVVEFIANGDGKIFTLNVKSLQFPIEGDYNNRDEQVDSDSDRYSKLVISYSKDLSTLTEGALIKLFNLRVCEVAEYYYETCATIPIKNGEPMVTEGIINGWDTYLVRRGIKYNDQTHNFSFPFLHNSPSDYWGDHCIDRGRVSVTNPYRKRLQFGRQLVQSETFLENSNYNGLGTFIDSFVKYFSGEQRGDITGCISMEQLLMMICEHDNFISNSADGFARVDGRSGQVMAANPDDVLTDAQSKIVGNYGCLYEDVGTILSGDGWVFWVDSINKLPVIHDWNVATDISEGQTSVYFINKLQRIAELKLAGRKIKMISGYDAVADYILLTFFNVAEMPTFVHSQHDFVLDADETIAYSVHEKSFPLTYSFTPEGYGSLPHSVGGRLFITFKKGLPYLHRLNGVTDFNTFFGISCDEVITVIVNELPKKVKQIITMQQQTLLPYFAESVLTSLGHTSMIPPIRMKKLTEGKYDAEFLSASNHGGIFGRFRLRGNSIKIVLVRENTVNFVIGTVDTSKQKKYNVLDSLMFKFMLSEQSAYNTND